MVGSRRRLACRRSSRWRRRSGGDWEEKPGLGASVEQGEARGASGLSQVRVEGGRRRPSGARRQPRRGQQRSGAFGAASGHRSGGKEGCGALGSQARANWWSGVLQRARHRGVEVAAARRLWKRRGCVARPGSTSARKEGGSGATRRCQREAKAKSELACGRSSAAAGGAVGGKQRSRQAKEEDRDLNAISKNFRDQTVKP